MEVAGRVRCHDLGAAVVEQPGLVAGDRSPARAGALLVERVRQEDVQRLGRADAVEHRVAEALAEASLQVGGERLTGRDRRPHAGEGGGRRVGVEQGGDEAGAGEEQRRLLGGDELDDARRRRPARLEDRRRSDRQRERQAVAEAVGEEQLGDGQEAVVRRHAEHLGGVRVGRRLQAAVAVHHALRHARRAGAVEPERRRVGGRRRHRERSTFVELGPPVHGHGEVVALADDDGVLDGRGGGDDRRQVWGVLGGHDDGLRPGVGDDRRELAGGEHRRDRHRDDTGPQGTEEPGGERRLVVDDEDDAVALPDAQRGQRLLGPERVELQLGVGHRRPAAADRHPVTATTLDVAVEQPARRVVAPHPCPLRS